MELIERINRGGFGVVDKVRLNNGTIVAKKTFSPSVPINSDSERQKLLNRFKREVKYQSSINCESICPILDYDLSGDNPWFTMPFAEKTLLDEINECKSNGTIPSQALADVLNALEKLHDLGFTHRDLKPQNILLIDGIWKLTDFGLVLPPIGTTTQLTSTGSAWGTLEYAAPEQSSEFHSVDNRADIYAFGCILHDIFGTPPRIPYARHSAPGRIGAIIERCTEIRPDRRFVSVSALRSVLISILSEPSNIQPSATASDWADSIKNNLITDLDKFEELVRYIKYEANNDDKYSIFYTLDYNAITELYNLSSNLWKTLVIDYCDWISSTAFQFEYCDVLVNRLELIFSLGDLEMKAKVVLTAAELGRSHNRWHVMSRVINMCGPDLEESVAERICIDIKAFEMEETFRICADQINHSYTAYHPMINNIITMDS